MSFQRTRIFSALFDLLSSGYGFVTAERKLKLWEDVPVFQRPALFMYQGKEDNVGSQRMVPPVVHLNVEVFIYVNTSDAEVPADILNEILDALDLVLTPDPMTGKVTLGGLVDHVYKDGSSIVIPGDLDGDGIAIVPYKIRVA